MTVRIKLRYGKASVHADLSGGSFLGELRPNNIPAIADLDQEIADSLSNPIGTGPLKKVAEGTRNAAILISDHTRPLPSHLILPLVCRELEAAGLTEDAITVVIGLGNHRPVTEDEKRQLLGSLYGRVRAVHSQEVGYRMLGITKRGTPVEVAEPVAAADMVIALGNIELHQLAGYTGGVKAVAVGAASPRAIEHNHRLSRLAGYGPGSLDGNLVRHDMEEFAGITKLKFIVNLVLNESHQAVQVVAGDPVKAHRSGCLTADRLYRVKVSRKADIVVVAPGGHPKDASVYQAQKAIRNALPVTVDGGVIIVAAQCPEGFGDPIFEEWMTQADSPGDIVQRSSREFVLGGHKGVFLAEAVRKVRVFWVSDMDSAAVKRLFFQPYASLQEALDAALVLKGDKAAVFSMPYGGLTFPYGVDDTMESAKKQSEDIVAAGV